MTCCTSERPHDVDPDDGGDHWIKPPPVPEHPAKFTPAVLDAIRKIVVPEHTERGELKVLDPFAGIGGIHDLADVGGIETYGVELVEAWARARAGTICGSVMELPLLFPRPTFSVLATSYCYGNRMADSHVAKDPCKACDGKGTEGGARCGCGAAVRHVIDCGKPAPLCKTCKGSGLSKRNTYTHYLVRQGIEPPPKDEWAGAMQWGPKYRAFHTAAWKACRQVLLPGALVILNGKNHYRGDDLQRVVEFHLNDWLVAGAVIEQVRKVPVKGNRQGANGHRHTDAEKEQQMRVPYETVAALRMPA